MYKSIVNLFLWSIILPGCASIVSKNSYMVRIASSPDAANVQVVDRNGREIFTGPTPAQVLLKCGSGYFRRAIYTVRFTKPGFIPKNVVIESNVNGWYFGNLVFGGLIGFLVVDPLTGAMYRLDRTDLNETLAMENRTGSNTQRTLEIVDINKLPGRYKQRLVLLANTDDGPTCPEHYYPK